MVAAQRKSIPGATSFAAVMFAISWWCICDSVSALTNDIKVIERISLMSYAGILGAPTFWMLFSLEYSGIIKNIRAKILPRVLLLLFGLITFIQLNEYHHLIYVSSTKSPGDFSSTFQYGEFFWFLVIGIYISLLIGSVLLVYSAIKASSAQRKSITLIVIAAFIPWIGNLFYLLKLIPIKGFDPTPFSFTITGLIVIYEVFQRKFLSIQPMAYEQLFNSLQDAVFLFGQDLKIVEQNDTARQLFNRSLKAGDNADKWFEASGIDLNKATERLDLSPVYTTEVQLKSKPDGWFSLSFRKIEGKKQQGHETGYILSLRDITTWKRTELNLQINAKLLSQVSLLGEELLHGTHWTKIFAKHQPEILHESQATGATLVLPEHIHLEDEKLLSFGHIDEVKLDQFLTHLKTEKLQNLLHIQERNELVFAHIPLETKALPKPSWIIVWEQKDKDYARMLIDVLKLAANVLASGIDNANAQTNLIESREEAINANMAKSEFLSIMSHEIRTPLNAIIGLSHILHDELKSTAWEEKIQTLHFSANNLQILVNDILDYNKIEAGKLQLMEEEFDLRDLVKKVLNENKLRADELENTLALEMDESVPSGVRGDKLRLTQVLNNLISNATKFTKGGKVTAKVSCQNQDDQGAIYHIAIQDTSIGMPKEFLPRLFESFSQASTKSTRKYGGTGLGLAISKRLLELMGGEIKVESQEGKGSTFHFTIPLKVLQTQSSDEADTTAVVPKDSLNGKRILLVEDNAVNVFVAKSFLSKWGCDYEVAENGKVAVEKVSEVKYDLILMDLQMPVMDGYEATKEIRKFNTETPIIALTASALLDSKEVSKLIGMNDHVTKPFKPDELYTKLVKFTRA